MGKGGIQDHHCAICKATVKPQCVKKGHVEFCDKHPTETHRPGWECVSCVAAERREILAERKAAEAARIEAGIEISHKGPSRSRRGSRAAGVDVGIEFLNKGPSKSRRGSRVAGNF
ncbi:hypothetical protein BDV18DRAFT_164660 [Aspergillus unguis]